MSLKSIWRPAQAGDAVEAVCCLSFLYNHTTRLSLWKKGAHFISVLNQHSTILSHRLTCPWSGMFFCHERKWNNVHTYFAEMLLLLQAKLSHPFYFIQFSLSSSVWAVLWTWNSQLQNGPHFRPDCNCNHRAMYHFETSSAWMWRWMRYTVINAVSHHRKVSPWYSPTKIGPRKIFNKPCEHRNESSVVDVCQHQSNPFLSPVSSTDGRRWLAPETCCLTAPDFSLGK